jgi:23S rRNA (guanosine2251-2'-O)-methyltransferase
VKTEILFGIHPIREALNARQRHFFDLYIARNPTSKRLSDIVSHAQKRGISVSKIPAESLAKLSQTDFHQGVGAKVSALPLKDLALILHESPQPNMPPMLLLLDSLSDPHNFGALVRSAVSVGISGIIFPKDRSVAPSPTVSKISAGALEHAALSRVTNLAHTIKRLKALDFWVCGLDRDGARTIFEVDFSDPMAIVIGSESKGLRPLIKKQCDFLTRIPQIGPVSSLNASVAGAVTLYEAFRQRSRKIAVGR